MVHTRIHNLEYVKIIQMGNIGEGYSETNGLVSCDAVDACELTQADAADE